MEAGQIQLKFFYKVFIKKMEWALPKEMWEMIGSHLNLKTLRSLAFTCRRLSSFLLKNKSAIIKRYSVCESSNEKIVWRFLGKLHREYDLPAIIYANGDQFWYQHNKRHRDNDLPAVIYENGTQHWYRHDKRHRDNNFPAVICPNGVQQWFQHNKLHRDNDLPAVIHADGTQIWYQDDYIHRDNDLPAVIYANGEIQYWVRGHFAPKRLKTGDEH